LLRRALAAAPKDLDALFDSAAAMRNGRFAEGLALLQKSTLLRPGFAEACTISATLTSAVVAVRGAAKLRTRIRADSAYPRPAITLYDRSRRCRVYGGN
jgi:hypothetical protein